MNTHFATLSSHFRTILFDEAIVFNGTQHHVFRKTGGTIQTHGEPPFAIQGNEQGYVGYLLHTVGHIRLCLWISFVKQDAADLEFIHVACQFLQVAGVILGVGNHHEELSDALVRTHRIEYRIDPVIHLCLIDLLEEVRYGLTLGCQYTKAGN